jgi:hypothetical protein
VQYAEKRIFETRAQSFQLQAQVFAQQIRETKQVRLQQKIHMI